MTTETRDSMSPRRPDSSTARTDRDSEPEGRGREQTATSLGGRFRRGLRLSLLNTVLSRAGTFLLGVLLARLFVPEQFGVYAAALVVQQLLLTVNDLGAAAALVRRPTTSTEFADGAASGPGERNPPPDAARPDSIDAMLPTAWTLSLLWSAVGAVICLLSAGGLAGILGSPAATDLIRVMAVTLILDGLASVPAAVLTRELRQARRLAADVSGMALNLTLTALLAIGGLGPWALVIGNVGGTAVTAVLVMALAGVWPRFGFDRRYGAEITRCGATMLGASILFVIVQATPQSVTGSLLGASALGFFYLASNMANWPAVLVSVTVERVALATFSRARDAGRDLSSAVAAVLGLVCAVVLPGGVALAVLAGPLVEVVYGSRWSPASAALAGLALAAMARVVVELIFALLIAVDEMASSVLLVASWAAVSVPATLWAAGNWGLSGVAWAQAAVALLVAIPIHLVALRRARVSIPRVLAGSVGPLLAASTCGLVLLGLSALALPSLVELAIGGVLVGVTVLLGVLRAQRRVELALGDAENDQNLDAENATTGSAQVDGAR